jgi:phosphatidylglycerophosphatase A
MKDSIVNFLKDQKSIFSTKISKWNGPSIPFHIKMIIFFLTYFGSGFAPFAPGTFASILTLPLILIFQKFFIPFYFFEMVLFVLTLTLVSIFITEYLQKKYSLHDPQFIVIDETIGMLTAWLFIPAASFYELLFLCFLFRIFDIFKPMPASYFNDKVTHGAGVILDDVASGLMAGISFILFKKFIFVLF